MAREDYYRRLAKDKRLKKYLNGWLARLDKFPSAIYESGVTGIGALSERKIKEIFASEGLTQHAYAENLRAKTYTNTGIGGIGLSDNQQKMLSFIQKVPGWHSIDHSEVNTARSLYKRGLIKLVEYPRNKNGYKARSSNSTTLFWK